MMRILGIIILLIFSFSCKFDSTALVNGLTKGAYKITETLIEIDTDSLGNVLSDTTFITNRLYDEEDRIIKRIQKTLFDNEMVIIDYSYNDFGLIQQEVVWMSVDSISFIVDYYYQDSILRSAFSEKQYDDFYFSNQVEFKYHSNGEQKEVNTNYVIIFEETPDTTLKQEIDYFDANGIIVKSEFKNNSDSTKNNHTSYWYNKDLLSQTILKDYKDSILSEINFIYEFDEFKNWTERKSIKNNQLVYRRLREINYR